MDEWVDKAARQVVEARLGRQVLKGLPGIERHDVEGGYRVLQRANAQLATSLGPVVGYKIGATSAYMREYLGVTEPVFGEIFASTVQHLNGQVPLSGYRRLGIETEIAVVLARDLVPSDRPHDRNTVLAAVDSVHAAVELVDDRYDDFGTIGAATLAADNFFGAGIALGRSFKPTIAPLDQLGARTILDGEEVASGTSSALLGHPMDALLWFAEHRRRLNMPVPAGTVVTLGSITPVFWIERPMVARIEIEQLGAVNVHITAG